MSANRCSTANDVSTLISLGLTASDFEQSVDDAVEFAADLVSTSQRGDGALFDATGLVPVGLDELDVAARTGGGDLDKHAATLSHHYNNAQ
jgi:hypothetical protein